MGRFLAILLVVSAVVGGGAMYYLQVYGYYVTLPAQDTVTVQGADGLRQVPVRDFAGIDADSSPIRYRACFTLEAPLPDPVAYDNPTPLLAPGWFDCFDAAAIGTALDRGEARAVLGEANFRYGFDRVIALFPDGRAFAWNQINACGTALFDGDPLPPGCPPPPASES